VLDPRRGCASTRARVRSPASPANRVAALGFCLPEPGLEESDMPCIVVHSNEEEAGTSGKMRAAVQSSRARVDGMKTTHRRAASGPKNLESHAADRLDWSSTPKAGRPSLDELARRKSKVMHVATALFVKHGYAATSIVDIAKGAGVATRTVYQHFGDKEAIFRHVMFARDTAAVFSPPPIQAED
jgi:hypothetical protein